MKTFETSREFPASIEQVFAAFSDPSRLAKWWGPSGFTNTFHVCEMKSGGQWKFVMHGPDGKDYKNESVFAEIDSPRKIVIRHENGPKYTLTIALTQLGSNTKVDWSQCFDSEEVAARIESIVVPSNEQNLDRWMAEVARVANEARDEAEIRRLIAAWSAALEAKDVAALTADYLPDTVLYDAIPPYKTVGKEAIAALWSNCLPYFLEQFKSEHRDVTIHVSGDLAIVHCLHHFVPIPADHPSGQTWMRVTVGYRRIEGKWKVLHEHVSIPFNTMNNQAWHITNPDVLDQPDYGEVPGE